jgi:hypothetical protein
MKCVAPLLCYFLPKNIISNLFELFFQQKNTAYSPVHHATSQRTRSLQLSPQSNAPLSPLLNTYAKTPPTSFHAGCAGNRSVESPSACHRMRRTPPPIPMLFLPKILFQIYLNYFFSKKHCLFPRAPRHKPTHTIPPTVPSIKCAAIPPSYVIFTQKIISNLFELFISTKNPYTSHRVPHIGPLLNRRYDNISGYKKNAPLA